MGKASANHATLLGQKNTGIAEKYQEWFANTRRKKVKIMPLFECFTKGIQLIEADNADEARKLFAELVLSEPTSGHIAAIETEGDEE